MAANLAQLDSGRPFATEYVELMSSTMAALACDPSELSEAAQQDVFQVASSLLQSVLTQEAVSLKDSKTHLQV